MTNFVTKTDCKWAAVFPGQGSQSLNMLSEFADSEIIQNVFEIASEQLGYNLWQLITEGPVEKLNQTEFAQPAILTASVAMWEYLRAKKLPAPVVLAGHSLGEFTALVCARAIRFVDAVKLVAERGRLMQAAVPIGEGAMGAIIKLDNDTIQSICDEIGGVQPANYNSIGQTVVAGKTAAVEAALALAKEKGAKLTKLLPMSVPSHCALMQSAADGLRDYLKNVSINPPLIPVLHNCDVQPHSEPSEIRAVLVQQLTSPVRWVDTIQTMATSAGVEVTIEIGPGKVLQGLNKRINNDLAHFATCTRADIGAALEREQACVK